MAFDLSASDAVTNFSLTSGTSMLYSPVSNLSLNNNSQATTTASGNVTSSVSVNGGSTLTLGAPLTLGNSLDVEGYSTLDMGGNPVSAYQVLLGYESGQPVTVLNRVSITATYLNVANMPFDLSASDTVTNFSLSGGTSTLNSSVSSLTLYSSAQATTTASGNATASVGLVYSCTLTLGAPMALSGQIDVEASSTLNMAGNPLSANSVTLGWSYAGQPVTVLNRAPITATNLNVGQMAFDLGASDAVTNFSLTSGTSTLYSPVSNLSLNNNSQATTTASGNVTSSVSVNGGSTLTLGAPLTLGNSLDVEGYSTLDMGGNPMSPPTRSCLGMSPGSR